MEGDDKSRELQNQGADAEVLEGGPRTTGASPAAGDRVPPTPPPAEMADGGITPQNIQALTGQVLTRPPRTEEPPSRESQKRASVSKKAKRSSKEELKEKEQAQDFESAAKEKIDLNTVQAQANASGAVLAEPSP
jgi:hypothetical protein